MFGTILWDEFDKDSIKEVYNAIDDLCSPMDNYGWASSGIYCFWDPYNKNILYLGLAVDVGLRFKQHTGLVKVNPDICKIREIEDYFKENAILGYSILVMSPLAQPYTGTLKQRYLHIEQQVLSSFETFTNSTVRDLQSAEGILIEAHKQYHGNIPPWNKIGGSKYGQEVATMGNYKLVSNMINPSILRAHYSIRKLSDDPSLEKNENDMHAIRMLLLAGMNLNDSINYLKKSMGDGFVYKLKRNGYF